jgi:hypothetical protein
MSVLAGTRIGVYEITALLGAGGRGRDTLVGNAQALIAHPRTVQTGRTETYRELQRPSERPFEALR